MHTYYITTIDQPEAITGCAPLDIELYYWDSLLRPKTSARLAYLTDRGFMVHMATEGSPVPAIYHEHGDPVYKDSAMECFMCFNPETDTPAYFNFEINGNGAALAGFGPERENRLALSLEDIESLNIETAFTEEGWSIRFLIPFDLIRKYTEAYVPTHRHLTFNFYKICEAKTHLHFGSLAPLDSPTPNFHLPHCFLKGSI